MLIGRGILPLQSKLILGGSAKVGKSYVVLNLGLALAEGAPIFDAKYPNGTPVLRFMAVTACCILNRRLVKLAFKVDWKSFSW